MEIALLATGAVSMLTAFVTKAGETLAQKAGEEIFRRLQAYFTRKPALQEALTDLQQKPDDPDLNAAMRVQMRKLLENDPALAQSIERILNEANKNGVSNTTIINQTARDNATQFGEVHGNIDLSRKG